MSDFAMLKKFNITLHPPKAPSLKRFFGTLLYFIGPNVTLMAQQTLLLLHVGAFSGTLMQTLLYVSLKTLEMAMLFKLSCQVL
jgi:SAM-dependent MidA family methyltransferase